MDTLQTSELHPSTPDGWRLDLRRTAAGSRLDRSRRPLMIVPGYGMNGFIFSFHPRGTSLVRHLAEAGLEVWVANLRGQGRSARLRRDAPGPSLRRYAEIDLSVAIGAVLDHTQTRADRVDLIGASLGGSLAFAHLALAEAPRIGSLVAVGSPLRWEDAPALLRIPFRSHRVARLLRVRGTRRMAGVAMPLAARFPRLLSVYMNPANIDMSAATEMIRTIEDPHPRVNSDIARWLAARDMVLRGVNVTRAARERGEPLLVVLANRDGIVPEATARSAARAWGGEDVSTLRVGDDDVWYAHADLFVGRDAPAQVFDPIARWLRERG